jgi:hypothetical protein
LSLGLLSIGGGAFFTPSHPHANVGPSPAKAMAVVLFHEILIEDRTIEPEIVAPANLEPFAT